MSICFTIYEFKQFKTVNPTIVTSQCHNCVLKLLAAAAQRFGKLRLVTLTAVKSLAAQTDLYLQSRVGRTVTHPGELPATQGFGSCFSASAASVRALGQEVIIVFNLVWSQNVMSVSTSPS